MTSFFPANWREIKKILPFFQTNAKSGPPKSIRTPSETKRSREKSWVPHTHEIKTSCGEFELPALSPPYFYSLGGWLLLLTHPWKRARTAGMQQQGLSS